MNTRTLRVFVAMFLWTVSAASAQAVRSGKTFSMGGTPAVITPDAAYDPVHDRYFVVHGHGFIEGLLTGADGQVIGRVTVNASRNAWPGEYAQTPRVVFSPDVNNGAGGYLVTWHESITGVLAQARARLLSADATPLGPDFIVSTEATGPGKSTNWMMGAAVAYASGSKEFLVAWMGSYSTTNDIRFTRVNLSGTVLQAPVTITAGTPEWERDPAVVYNPDADEFFVAYAGYHDAKGYAYVSGQRVKAGTGQLLGTQLEYTQTLATYAPAVTYNSATKQYFLAWYHRTSGSIAFYGVHLNADATTATPLKLLSGIYVSYDALDVKYNPISGDYLLVTHGNNWEDAAVSIRANGTPYDNGFIVTNTPDFRPVRSGDGNFNPRLAVSTKNPTWLVVTSSGFGSVGAQFVKSLNTAGPTPPPVIPVSAPLMNIDTPGNATSVSSAGFHVAGWAIDRGAPSGPGVDAVHVWAWPIGGGSPTFLGAAILGIARPDVGGAYGAAFSSAGFGLIATGLPAGTYDLTVYAHSTVTGNFDIRRRRITVAGPVSLPRMAIDLPAPNQSVPRTFTIAGWAADLGAQTTTGVDTVHMYAYPAGNPNPIWLGAATYGHARPDVAGAFGASRFGASGYWLTTSVLPPGPYTIVVFAHSTVAGTFNNAQTVTITVR